MQRRLIAYEQSGGIVTEEETGIAEVKLPDIYGEREVAIAVRQAANLEYLDRFVDLGRVPEEREIGGMHREDFIEEAVYILSSKLAD